MRFSVEESPLRGKALCILQNGMVASYQKGNLVVAAAEGPIVKKKAPALSCMEVWFRAVPDIGASFAHGTPVGH